MLLSACTLHSVSHALACQGAGCQAPAAPSSLQATSLAPAHHLSVAPSAVNSAATADVPMRTPVDASAATQAGAPGHDPDGGVRACAMLDKDASQTFESCSAVTSAWPEGARAKVAQSNAAAALPTGPSDAPSTPARAAILQPPGASASCYSPHPCEVSAATALHAADTQTSSDAAATRSAGARISASDLLQGSADRSDSVMADAQPTAAPARELLHGNAAVTADGVPGGCAPSHDDNAMDLCAAQPDPTCVQPCALSEARGGDCSSQPEGQAAHAVSPAAGTDCDGGHTSASSIAAASPAPLAELMRSCTVANAAGASCSTLTCGAACKLVSAWMHK